jgi:hypothetical protein
MYLDFTDKGIFFKTISIIRFNEKSNLSLLVTTLSLSNK